MRRVLGIRSLLLAALLVVFSLPQLAGAQPGGNAYVPGEVILKFKANASEQEKDQIRTGLGGSHVRGLGKIKAELRRLGTLTVEEAVAEYRNHPKVQYIEPNYVLQADEVPNDARFSELWGMLNTGQTGGTAGADISATNAWDVFTGSDQVLVGVIDTGVDYTHPDLAANIYTNPGEIPGNGIDDDNNGYVDDVRGWDFINNDNDPMDDNGHGSHVSGTIGGVGNNGIGVAGVSWNIKIVPLKFLSAGGSGSTADAVDAVAYATQLGVRLTSNSWGGGGFSQALYDAIQDANQQGILFVAAAGNSGANTDVSPHYPSSYDLPNIVAVAATDHNDQLASFSSYGATTVDLAAPGVNILSTFPGNTYGTISGTSMATPHVSGALGLVFGRFPVIGHLDAKNLILNFVDPLPSLSGVVLTGGRLNAFFPIADPDNTPPGAVTDLAVTEAGSNWLIAGWSATGDDGMVGTASRYVVKYSTAPITDANFDMAMTAPNPPDPGPPGTLESMKISGLDFNTTYYIAVKVLDEFGNPSPVSNVPSGTTLGIPDIAATPLSFTETLLTGGSSTQSLTLSNVGFGTLDWNAPPPQLIVNPAVVTEYVALGKDEPDAREGILGSGGPDGFGYRWTDSDAPTGPAFNWTDISGTGTLLISTGDDVNNGPHPIGFTFSFYGVEFDNFRVCSNGWLSFNSSATSYSNQPLPNSGAPTALVAPFWDDLNLTTSGDVYYQSDGTRLIVQWNNVAHYGSGGPYTFQAILESDGTILFQYLTMGSPTNSSTIGIQNPSRTDGLQVVYNANYVHDNMAVRIAAVPQWVTVSPASGTIYAPNSAALNVDFDATGLLGGVYDANILVLSNDPDENPFTIPVQMTVIGAPDIELAPATIAFGPVFLGATPTDVLHVQNPGTDFLTVSSVTVDDAVYSLSPTAFTVPPHGSVDVTVTFAPIAVGSHPATVTVNSDDPDEPVVTMSLSGSGVVPPDFSVTPTELNASLYTGGTEIQQLTLSNSGGADLEWSAAVQFLAPSQLFTLTAPEPPSMTPDADGGLVRGPARTTPIQIELNDLTGVDILWDRSHGQSTTSLWTTLIADFETRGATVTQSTAPLTPELLANYDVMWCVDTGSSAVWTPEELAAIVSWINNGGGLLLEGDNVSSVGDYNDILAALGAGITFSTTSGGSGTTTNIYPHPTTENVTGVYFTANVASIPTVVAPGVPVVDDVNGLGAAAASEVGAGRVFGVSDEVFQNSRMSQADNQLFGNQVMDWLAGNAYLTVNPTSGTVSPGGSQVLDAHFDATGMFGGLYEANIVLTTNDPLAPEVIVPAALQVTGAPNLALDPASIDFGDVFVGYPDLHEVQITNTGTDMLTITGLATNNPAFTWFLAGGSLPIQLAPLASTVLQVRFAPPTAAPHSGSMTIASNDPDSPHQLSVTGVGLIAPVASAQPTSLSADLFTGDTETQTVTLTNSGGSDLSFSIASQLSATAVTVYDRPDLAKEEEDPNPGILGSGGPDVFGYSWIDSDEPGGPLFDWVDISGVGTGIYSGNADDSNRGPFPIGFEFPFYGNNFSTFRVSSNGFITFTSSLSDLSNAPLPGTGAPENLLALFHDDMYVDADIPSQVYYHNDGGRLIVQFHNVRRYNQSDTSPPFYDMEAILYPNGKIVYQYLTVAASGNNSATIGIQNAARDDGLTVVYNDNYVHDNLAIRISTVPDWLSANPADGVVPPGSSMPIAVTFDATGLFGGGYDGRLLIESNDPAHGVIEILGHLGVTGVPLMGYEPDALSFGDVFIGYPKTLSMTMSNVGTDVLTISSMTAGLADYSLDATTFSLNPLESREVLVTFDPQSAGTRATDLLCVANDAGSPHVIALSGVGVVPPVIGRSPGQIVGAALPGGSKTKTLTVCNTGGSDLIFSVADVEHASAVTVHGEITLPKQADEVGSQEAIDPRPSILGTGGPDLFGYTWIDSDEPGGPTYDWTDISSVGTPVPFASYVDDGNVGPVPIGFNFPFYGNAFSEVYVCSNGWLSFTNSTLRTYTNQPLPNSGSSTPENLLAPWWDDMVYDESDGNNAYYYNDGSRFIIQLYIRRIAASTPPFYLMQVILYPNGKIVYQYHTLGATLNSSTIGIQNATKDDGLTVVHNDGTYPHEGLAIQFSARPDWLNVTPTSGVVPAGECVQLAVTMDASELEAGDYTGTVALSSNDPATPTLETPVLFHVGSIDVAAIDIDPDVVNVGSNGRWVTAFVELPLGYSPDDIVLETVLCNGVPASSQASTIGDFNGNGIPDRQFKFSLAAVAATLEVGEQQALTVTGEIEDVIYFTGTAYLRVIHPQLQHPNGNEVLAAGSLVDVLWTNPQGYENAPAALSYSGDNGETWTPVADGITGHSFSWQVPFAATTGGLMRVYLYVDGENVLGFDTSDQPFTIVDGVTGVEDELPTEYGLRFAVANPVVHGPAAVELALPQPGPVTVNVYNVHGALVRQLANSQVMPAGRHRIEWDRTNRAGSVARAGVYFIRAEAVGHVMTTRFVVIR